MVELTRRRGWHIDERYAKVSASMSLNVNHLIAFVAKQNRARFRLVLQLTAFLTLASRGTILETRAVLAN